MHAAKAESHSVIEMARQASQTAEDARLIAVQRQQQDKLVAAQTEVLAAQKAKLNAEAALQQAQAAAADARAQAETERTQLEIERAARERAEQERAAARDRSAQLQAELQTRAQLVAPPPPPVAARDDAKAAQRNRLLQQLNGIAATSDTPRGLSVTLPDTDFRGVALREYAASQVARLTQTLRVYPGLRLEVDGNSDTAADGPEALHRAEAVGDAMARSGINRTSILVRGLADARPLGPNPAPGGREQNRRVEILVTGDAIGSTPGWEQGYPLSSQR
jgi:outer membrane protein OmpA-like peptidoglycan-associated protein